MSVQWCQNRGLAIFAVLILPALIALGNWQLRRADEKTAVLQLQEKKENLAPVLFGRLDEEQDWSYLPVIIRGHFDESHQFLLDNKVLNGKVGYEVLTPFVVEVGSSTGVAANNLKSEKLRVLINRGWIQAGRTRQDIPGIPTINALGTITDTTKIVGEIYVPPQGRNWFAPEQEALNTAQWPIVIQAFDTALIARAVDADVFDYQIRLSESNTGALPRDWPVVSVQPEKHVAYAVQWFCMAVALVIWYLFANTNLKSVLSKKKA